MLPTNPLLNATAPAGPHLPVALLRQYAAGTLAPAAQHRVEAHTLACPRCADILEGLLQTPAATTDQALMQLQQRLRQRVQQAAPARQIVAPRRHRWLAPQLAAAAALLLGLVAGGWWAWQQRQHAPTAARTTVAAAPQATTPAALPAPTAPPAAAVATTPVPTATPQPRATAPRVTRHPARAHPATAPLAAVASPAPATAPTRDSAVLAEVTAPAAAPVPTAAPSAAPARPSEPLAKLRAPMPPPPALPASPTGGYAALREYLKKGAAEFEPEGRDGGRQVGRVLVRLHLGADGKIEQAEAVRKLRPDYDAEAVRLLQEGPTWVPGITAGRRAAQVVEVPVAFE
ncbi:MAG: energy transducer TonB [Janthinobacterium lividum]